jgi:NADH:ubiquinone oxidoreductase subunit F (NADH-binding)/(2Fe-2S) ferredoxin
MPQNVSKEYQRLLQRAEDALQKRGHEGKTIIQVGSATCEDAAGAQEVYEEFHRHLEASGREDVVLRTAGCTGRCSCEPIVSVIVPGEFPIKYQNVDRELVHEIFVSHIQKGQALREHVLDHPDGQKARWELIFCRGGRCRKGLGWDPVEVFREKLAAAGESLEDYEIIESNCFGLCSIEEQGHSTHVLLRPAMTMYRLASPEDVQTLIDRHLKGGKIAQELTTAEEPLGQRFFDVYGDVAFFNRQSRIALRNSGIVDPEILEEYLHYGGFEALAKALDAGDRQAVIDEVLASRLRGRGGGGYPTGRKWQAAADSGEPPRYVICNADEGDPGAFMDRSMLEGDPFSIIEGMAICGFAIGAERGFLYIRAEYPKAIRRVQNAIELCREANLLGEGILGSSMNFDLEIRLGAGAFVCGEETALIHSIEGERGQPRIRPPYPSQSGLWGRPTVINNVETFANIPVVLTSGAEWFRRIGTDSSGGTKVFALAGKVEHTGLVEVPMGTTLRQIVFEIGGGVPGGKKLKAIQTGGPAGGCIPAEFLDTVVDFDSLKALGSIMGSGGMIVMDEDDCMVDIAKFFLSFSQDESCGKCSPCREGTKRMLEIIERITSGRGESEDIDKLERLAALVQKASLCGLGRAAPNPVLSTLRYFREEYLAHVERKSCPAKKCTALVFYEIDPDACVGCTACARNCPVQCISGEPKKPHVIDQARCIKCGKCYEVCRFDAVRRN